MNYHSLLKILTLFFVLLGLNYAFPVNTWCTYFLMYSFLFVCFWVGIQYIRPQDTSVGRVGFFYFLWIFSCIIRGIFIADNYWEWKAGLFNSASLLMPVMMYAYSHPFIVGKSLRAWMLICLPLIIPALLVLPMPSMGAYYLSPVLLLAFLVPFLKRKYAIAILLVIVSSYAIDIGGRSNLIRISGLLGVLSLYMLSEKRFMATARLLLLTFSLVPVCFLLLGIGGGFNIYNINQYAGKMEVAQIVVFSYGLRDKTASLTTDTRTTLFQETWKSAIRNNYILEGRSPMRGNDSTVFGDYLATKLQTGKTDRFANEVRWLNYFTWTGIIGSLLVTLLYWKASWLAVYRSKNRMITLLGVYVSFRWAMGWSEEFNGCDIFNAVIWLMLGMCFSRQFREMSDSQIGEWGRALFSFRKNSKSGRNSFHTGVTINKR